jgi:hypothetical protein
MTAHPPASPVEATLPPGPAPTEDLECDVCVVGGGIAGLCAALAAARGGARTVLLQDRAVLGGNASSEVRMWICGAHGADNRETGILEELMLANLRRNSALRYPAWDGVLYAKAREQPGLTLLLSCAVTDVEMAGARIAAVRGWHLTRQRWVRVRARLFADCSGDSVLRLSGAACRWGREGRAEFGESHAPAQADRATMGNSVLMQLRQIDPADHVAFVPPAWATTFAADHPRLAGVKPAGENFWWLEVGGLLDTVADADRIRDELLALAYGAWAFIKNHPDGRGHGWELEWIGALPGKRENVRYVGDHILSQGDVESCGVFADVVAHGGWSMDDHHPAAFHHPGEPTTYHPAPSPYGIPYRCLYSATVANLFMAGRNASCTHQAMSSTRVMGTTATMGQAIGTAAAIAIRHGTDPRGILQHHLRELQNRLMDDDQWLPDRRRPIPALTQAARLEASHGDPEPLRDGLDRRGRGAGHAWDAPPGAWVTLRFAAPQVVTSVRIVGDSQLHRDKRMPCSYPARMPRARMPDPLPRDLRIEALEPDGVTWRTVAQVRDNERRLLRIAIAVETAAVRLVIERAWGDGSARLFAFESGEADPLAAHEILPWPATAISGRGVA